MKNIYDLLNHAEDNGDIISENDRLEMSDIEKRRIYNRILLNSEENQEKHEHLYDEKQKYQYDEKKQQSESNYKKKQHQKGKKGGKIKKLLTAAACMAVICAVGFTAGAEVKEYLYKNTQYDYREKLDSTESEDTAADENGISGVSIQVTEVRMEEDSLTFDCAFTFEDDFSEMRSEMEQWAVAEGRNAALDQFFDNSKIYVDSINLLDDNVDYIYAHTDAFIYGKNVVFENNTMYMMFEIIPLAVGEDHTIRFCFKDLNMSDHTLEGSWEYTYEAKANAYEEELEWHPIEIKGENYDEKWILNRYAITPNGLKIDATFEKTRDHLDFSYEKDGYEMSDLMRIVAWDDQGNYYLMYPRSKDFNDDEWNAPYHGRFDLYDDIFGEENRDYKVVWDENASKVTFVIENVISKWDINTKLYAGSDYEFVSEPYTVDLTKD